MRDIELNGASPELLPELLEGEIIDEDEFEGLDESLLSSDADLELDDEELDEERRRLRRLVRRRPRPSRFPKRLRRPRPRRVVRPVFRRKVVVGRSEPCICPERTCPAHGSEYIRWVQSALNQRMGLNLRVNGVMNPATRDALRQFQQQQGLPSDGIAGPETKRALLDARGGGARDAAAGTAKSTDSTDTLEPAADSELFEFDAEELEVPLSRPILRRGSRGASVIELQDRLTSLGFSPGAADGIFGSQTKSAVKAFQRSRNITADGIVGSQTWSKLYGLAPAPASSVTGNSITDFEPIAVESKGGGRITDKSELKKADCVPIVGYGGKEKLLHHLAARGLEAMVKMARAEGIKAPLLEAVSTFRSVKKQELLWAKAVEKYGSEEEARKWVAPPGNSAHHSGRAIDLWLGFSNDSRNAKAMKTLPVYRWLQKNAVGFGFYPYTPEPWHWEYNPPATRESEIVAELYEEEWDEAEVYEDEGFEKTFGYGNEAVRDTELFEYDAEELEAPPARPILRRGSRGASVIELQDRLTSLGFSPGAADGIFGSQTKSAVKAFQRSRNIMVDGIVGSQTWGQLYGPVPTSLQPSAPGMVSKSGYSRISELAKRAESLGVPQGFAKFALIQASSESGGNRLVGLGLPGRFPDWAEPNCHASMNAQNTESAAAEKGYDRNLRYYSKSPHRREEWIFGSGGWFGFLPSSGLAPFRNTPLIASGEVYPYMVFEEWPSIVMLADFVRRITNLEAFRNLPRAHQNWLAIKRGGAGSFLISDYMEGNDRSRRVREKAEDFVRARGISPSFLRENVPVNWSMYPGAVELLRAGAV